jgi:hypothetical protein
LRKELNGYLKDRDDHGSVETPEWTLENIEREISPEDLRYFSTFDLKLSPAFEFTLTHTSLDDIVESQAPPGYGSGGSRIRTNMEELVRRFTPPKSYTTSQLKQYQKELFSVLNKRVSIF